MLRRCTTQGGLFRHFALRSMASNAPSNSMEILKALREKTGAPIVDVKKSLTACAWDPGTYPHAPDSFKFPTESLRSEIGGDGPELAFQELRKRGLAAVGKKSARTAAEGLLGVARTSTGVAFVEVNSETDFVARNPQFQELVTNIASAAAGISASAETAAGSVSEFPLAALQATPGVDGSLSDMINSVALVVRENINLRRAFWVPSNGGAVGTYVHKSPMEGLGSIAAAVVLSCNNQPVSALDTPVREQLEGLASKLAMHVVAVKPTFLSRDKVDSADLDKELDILRTQAQTSGKPPQIIEKIVQGRLNKYYEEVCLVDQKYVMDDGEGKKVKDVLSAMGKQLDVKLEVASYFRMECGEGIEKVHTDFAEEVQKMAR